MDPWCLSVWKHATKKENADLRERKQKLSLVFDKRGMSLLFNNRSPLNGTNFGLALTIEVLQYHVRSCMTCHLFWRMAFEFAKYIYIIFILKMVPDLGYHVFKIINGHRKFSKIKNKKIWLTLGWGPSDGNDNPRSGPTTLESASTYLHMFCLYVQV